ncbi:MAG: hypothetical protein KAJ15_05115, partial [Spirochaetes bacterium]|nr:hypothetical protein [Spirochaetota bacterium]
MVTGITFFLLHFGNIFDRISCKTYVISVLSNRGGDKMKKYFIVFLVFIAAVPLAVQAQERTLMG